MHMFVFRELSTIKVGGRGLNCSVMVKNVHAPLDYKENFHGPPSECVKNVLPPPPSIVYHATVLTCIFEVE